ncbi:GntR family transcriptional regulator [Lichenifustis flavocetrariae]|uniref:GntR family transcriptional regulator n=1 Tax=Lichenifustis flavocetrariae TaxID=2949735 RepID=A0AA41Z1W0_9HYPH|nr:GntR family transcriptional regulator [Lichenifustis flavocetrariae]MCW6511456.1 GntR family transcriptional regulator [Lichenifustis flavocetrariae]
MMAATASRNLLGQNAYRAILESIREGVYSPGDHLREQEVAEHLGVSRTPVREAMGRLQEKGLLEAAPGRGLAIATLTTEKVFELYAMRGELEAVVARFAAQHATDAEIENMRRVNLQFGAARVPNDAAKLNRVFHALLYAAARNRYLQAAVEDLQETITLLRCTTFTQNGRVEVASEEHIAILAAIALRDAPAAAEAARNHIKSSLGTRLTMIRADEGTHH